MSSTQPQGIEPFVEPTTNGGLSPCLEVDLAAVAANYRAVCSRSVNASVTAVVKSDAYGLGADPVARTLAANGCSAFWVNDLTEGLALRPAVPDATIFALQGLGVDPVAGFRAGGIVPVLTSLGEVETAAEEANRAGHRVAAAIKLDTGLGRLGLPEPEVLRLMERPDLTAALEIKAWVSHLAAFDRPGDPMNDRQRELFLDWTDRLPPAPKSLASSAAMFRHRDWHFDIARVGSALFGIQTSERWQEGLIPAYRLTATVIRVADLPAGRTVGYRGASRLTRPSRIATVDFGYSHGVPPAHLRNGEGRFGSHRAPFIGGTSMSLTMLDVTDLPADTVRVGTPCVIFDPLSPIEPAAERIGVAPNVLLTQIGGTNRRRHIPAPRQWPEANYRPDSVSTAVVRSS